MVKSLWATVATQPHPWPLAVGEFDAVQGAAPGLRPEAVSGKAVRGGERVPRR
jgi:hypothetical protein